jgi:hypothetical protein
MPDAAAWLLDTNILLRMSKSDDPHHPMIRGALRALVAQAHGSVSPLKSSASSGMRLLVPATEMGSA